MTESLRECTDLQLMDWVETIRRERDPDRWGWRIIDATTWPREIIDDVPEGDGLRGYHVDQGDALQAGVRYLRARHPEIVAAAKDEALQGIRYRAARRKEAITTD